MDGIHLAQLSRLVQRRQQVQKPLALGLVLTVQGDLGAYGGGQQTAAIDGGVSRRAGFLLHDLSGGAHQPDDAVLLPGQRVAALPDLDQQGIRQLPLDGSILDLNIGQGIGDIPNHLILVQQK